MRNTKIIALCILALFTFSMAAHYDRGNSSVGAGAMNHSPNDVQVVKLHSPGNGAAHSIDTFATTDIATYGPYPLSSSNSTGMFKGFQVIGDPAAGTTPNFSIDYQLVPGLTLKDTVVSWTPICTLNTAVNTYVDLTSKSGKSIVFRLNKFGLNAGYVVGVLDILFRENFSYQIRP